MRADGRLRANRAIATCWRSNWVPQEDGDSPSKRPLGAEQRRALQLLAGTPFGAAEAAMFLHGFTRRVLARLIHAGLAAVQREKAGGQTIGRIRITEAGRRTLEG
jgi:hypothetical protein